MEQISEHLGNRQPIKPEQESGIIYDKICPFQSTAKKQAPCTPQCKLYRNAPKNAGFECPFQELAPISFALRPKNPQQTQN